MSESHVEVLKTAERQQKGLCVLDVTGAERNHSLHSSCLLTTILIPGWSGSNDLKVYIPI